MKLLSIAVPCYNSQDYMEKCIDSLLTGGDDVEILIVDDGSKDQTAAIADQYEAKYPSIVKVIHKENGGHGSGVNTGIKHAGGMYFKVVDSDDWVDAEAFQKILEKLREFSEDEANCADMLISNFVYDKEGATHKQVMSYKSAFPRNEMFEWKDVMRLRKGQYILMHSVIYKTELLRECGLNLPEHTFYVDNLFVYVPLPYVKKLYYLDVDFYHYFIGREDQSVNEDVMIQRIDQQILVNKLMVEAYDLMTIKDEHLRKYMFNYLEIITTVSTALLLRSGTQENLQKKMELWAYLRQYNMYLYRKLRHGILGTTMNLPGKAGRKISVGAYKITQKVVGFN